MPQDLLNHYKKQISEGALQADPAQSLVVDELQRLLDDVTALNDKPQKGWFERALSWASSEEETPKGVYLYGSVGRGKSMLMDMFFDHLPENMPRRRVHFHEFMIKLHDYIHSRRSDDNIREGVDEAIPMFSERIAEKAKVLCFDEFHVTDVADAMILGRLFTALLGRGVIIVTTSNWPPERLYEGGLQRDRFLPFIELLKKRLEVVHIDSPTDYRKECFIENGTYFHPLNNETEQKVTALFKKLTKNMPTSSDSIEVKGRTIPVPVTAAGVARFSFADLCEQPLGAEDYIAISERYHTIFLENIPRLKNRQRNEAKRLMNLVDVLYENGINLAVSAEDTAEKLYTGSDHGFEFERTISRLLEMQSTAYLSHSKQ